MSQYAKVATQSPRARSPSFVATTNALPCARPLTADFFPLESVKASMERRQPPRQTSVLRWSYENAVIRSTLTSNRACVSMRRASPAGVNENRW
ncbi:MAG: hypothetical protein NTV91_10240 [Proteobacteria bacterium]|nr:hypothetical protein [Pseudomonadota bacterium]